MKTIDKERKETIKQNALVLNFRDYLIEESKDAQEGSCLFLFVDKILLIFAKKKYERFQNSIRSNLQTYCNACALADKRRKELKAQMNKGALTLDGFFKDQELNLYTCAETGARDYLIDDLDIQDELSKDVFIYILCAFYRERIKER